MNVKFRLVDAQRDAARILDIYAPYITDSVVTFEYEVPALADFRQRIVRVMEQFPWIVCEIDGQVAGYAYAAKQYERAAYGWNAELSVYLSSAFQGYGIGTALYRALLGLLTRQGYCNATARIAIPNEKSEALHRAFGFQTVGVFPAAGNKFGRWVDMLFLTKPLGEYLPCPPPPVSISALDPREIQDFLAACALRPRISAAG